MGRKNEAQVQQEALDRRICAGAVKREDVVRRLAELAFGKPNDCVRLALEEGIDLDSLNLSLLSEIKRSDKGMVEIKLIDRLRALEMLSQSAASGDSDAESFLKALMNNGEAGA